LVVMVFSLEKASFCPGNAARARHSEAARAAKGKACPRGIWACGQLRRDVGNRGDGGRIRTPKADRPTRRKSFYIGCCSRTPHLKAIAGKEPCRRDGRHDGELAPVCNMANIGQVWPTWTSSPWVTCPCCPKLSKLDQWESWPSCWPSFNLQRHLPPRPFSL